MARQLHVSTVSDELMAFRFDDVTCVETVLAVNSMQLQFIDGSVCVIVMLFTTVVGLAEILRL